MSRLSHVSVFLAFLTGATGLAAAGCGGGGDRLTREELIQEADATCQDFDQRVEEIDEPQSVEDIEGYLQEVRPIVEEGTDELDALEPPEELEDEYNQWIEETRSAVDRFDELEEAAASGDEQRIQEVFQDVGEGEEADRLAQELGFQDCGGGD
jgi:predicted nuclease with TOPRIM domain